MPFIVTRRYEPIPSGLRTITAFHEARGEAKIGSIRPGNFADLVVVSADPVSDIAMAQGKTNRTWAA